MHQNQHAANNINALHKRKLTVESADVNHKNLLIRKPASHPGENSGRNISIHEKVQRNIELEMLFLCNGSKHSERME